MTSISPDVSVVVPTHNRMGLLPLTLHTALWQHGVDIEVIVVDDGSTDDTLRVIRGLGDDRVRVVHHEVSRGVSSARNHGIDDAQGRWIAFLDDDDLWAPDKLVSQLRVHGATNSLWSYTGVVKVDRRTRIVGGAPPPTPDVVMGRLRGWNLVPGGCSGVMASRPVLQATGCFDPGLVNLADWDLWIRLAQHGPPGCAPEPLVGYRLHSGQASLEIDLILREADLLERKHGTSLDWGALHYYLAHKALLAGRRRGALKHFTLAAVRGEPLPVAKDLGTLVRARLSGLRRAAHPALRAHWRNTAEAWLRDVRGVASRSPGG
jgi:glycosyltransferase involved in cell wall biosynthesis